MRILLVEDDRDTARHVKNGLMEAGHNVDHTDNGGEALARAETERYDALIIDRLLPSCEGTRIIEHLRGSGNFTPILILSALGDVADRVSGLRSGGDDYLPKPFAFEELLARLDALVRRRDRSHTKTLLKVADLEMDILSRQVRREGQTIALQPREFRLLEFLMRHSGQVVTRTMLLENVWDYHFDPQTNVIDVHISRLRSKIDRGFSQTLLRTVRGSGYILREPE